MVIGDPFPEVQFRDEETDGRIVLYARHARRNYSLMHSDTLDFEKVLHEKGKRQNILCNLTQAMLTTAS